MAVAKLQAASVPVAHAAAPWDRQMDRQTDGWTALFQNAHYQGIKTLLRHSASIFSTSEFIIHTDHIQIWKDTSTAPYSDNPFS